MSLGIPELAIILVIVLLLFGTAKLTSLGSDLGSAIKGFRTAISDNKSADEPEPEQSAPENQEKTGEQESGEKPQS